MKSTDKGTNKIRLQVYLSRNGVCSRRDAMHVIQNGRVKLNNKIEKEPSVKVDPLKDKIAVDNKLIDSKQYQYVLLNKKKGFVTTKAEGHKDENVFKLLPKKFHHLLPVGRLDKDTEGLLLFTNDGDCAYKLTHPRFEISKEYYVVINKSLKGEDKKVLEKGIILEGKKTSPAKIRPKGQTKLIMTIHEGRKRQIRRMFEKLRYDVTYLKRLKQGPISLGRLPLGKVRSLTAQEIKAIKKI